MIHNDIMKLIRKLRSYGYVLIENHQIIQFDGIVVRTDDCGQKQVFWVPGGLWNRFDLSLYFDSADYRDFEHAWTKTKKRIDTHNSVVDQILLEGRQNLFPTPPDSRIMCAHCRIENGYFALLERAEKRISA